MGFIEVIEKLTYALSLEVVHPTREPPHIVQIRVNEQNLLFPETRNMEIFQWALQREQHHHLRTVSHGRKMKRRAATQ